MKKILKTMLSGLIVGSAMLLPGVSGGTTAIILGCYDKLIGAVSGIFKEFKKNFLYLFQFAMGALVGFLLFAKLIEKLLITFDVSMRYLFLGAIVGTIPMLYRKAIPKVDGKRDFKWTDALLLLLGVLLLMPMAFVQNTTLFQFPDGIGLREVAILFVAGIAIAVALVLPGISVSFTLLILGIYERTLSAIANLDIVFLFPLAFGVLVGTFACAALLEKAMEKFTRQTYLIIGGFVLASVFELFPGIPSGFGVAVCVAMFIAGFMLTFLIGKRDK
ncbi:MAG: DUF368 domain-containing protein [Oscillospiraceae bacterium]|jgi:putative membrane protein|nr:DUF368 domain-containing protein [Oscillospiraceae bacterium]